MHWGCFCSHYSSYPVLSMARGCDGSCNQDFCIFKSSFCLTKYLRCEGAEIKWISCFKLVSFLRLLHWIQQSARALLRSEGFFLLLVSLFNGLDGLGLRLVLGLGLLLRAGESFYIDCVISRAPIGSLLSSLRVPTDKFYLSKGFKIKDQTVNF